MTALLQEEPGFEMLVVRRSAGPAPRPVLPDVVLIEDVPTVPVAEAVGRALRPYGETRATRALIVMETACAHRVFGYLRLGVRSFVSVDAAPDVLLSALRATARGEAFLTHDVARRVIETALPHGPDDVSLESPLAPPAPLPPRTAPLTAREREIHLLLTEGRSNAEIAEICGLSSKTVKFHVSNILRKLGMRNRIQAVVHAARSRGRETAA
ncbi:response regulator transcription factor [Streptomyces sp. MBT55]|uniref:response regulator transcription factor n=1 Tax=Streptomyces sp. MBT55 TaxID=1488386 RepID=UPI0019147664|nr:response regulator transcription factor [Streptomyces sp. MBT55]MBK6043606.1 response regulator transcription factor [Streptomyces sp. MBT55]